MNVRRPKIQYDLAFDAGTRGEAPKTGDQGTETSAAKRETERRGETEHLLEEICESNNLRAAYRQVVQNKGAPGVDGMTVDQLQGHLQKHWTLIKEQLFQGNYRPQPVKRTEIPKPDGGLRKLGIPTVTDRFLQQAVAQVLQKRLDGTFSEHSYGFRPNRSAHQAVAQAQEYVAQGYHIVVDLDIEKFFDTVNQDRLMGELAKRMADKRVLKLIRAFLKSGVLEDGLVSPTDEGTPQGGPLSPLLSNLYLDALDQELTRRGLRFVRYADDCNIYVKSLRAGERVMASISAFLSRKLKLKINARKSAVARSSERKFLSFRFTEQPVPKRVIAPQALKRFRRRVRQLTRRRSSVSLESMIERLTPYVRGWFGYFRFCQVSNDLLRLDGWIRRRFRAFLWKQWKTPKRRQAELLRLGVRRDLASRTAASGLGAWRVSKSPALDRALSIRFFEDLGLFSLAKAHSAH